MSMIPKWFKVFLLALPIGMSIFGGVVVSLPLPMFALVLVLACGWAWLVLGWLWLPTVPKGKA